MDAVYREALNIVRGEQNGDEFVWDVEYEDDEGVVHIGAFKSDLKKLGLSTESDDDDVDLS